MGPDVQPLNAPPPSLWRAFWSRRTLLNLAILGSIGRYALTFTITLGKEAALASSWALPLILSIVALASMCDLLYTVFTNYRYQYQRFEYTNGRQPNFTKDHKYKHSFIQCMSWGNLIKYAFRGSGAAVALAIIISGNPELTNQMLYISVAAGTTVGWGLSLYNKWTDTSRETAAAKLRKEEEALINWVKQGRKEAVPEQDKTLYQDQRPLTQRARHWPELLIAIFLCAELGRRAILFPNTIDHNGWLIGEGLYPIIAVWAVLYTMDIAYSYIKNLKLEYNLDQLRAKNEGIKNNTVFAPKMFSKVYPRAAFAEKILKPATLLRYFFPAASVIVGFLIVADAYENPVFSVLSGGANQLLAICITAAVVGIGLAILAESSENTKKSEVEDARSYYLSDNCRLRSNSTTDRDEVVTPNNSAVSNDAMITHSRHKYDSPVTKNDHIMNNNSGTTPGLRSSSPLD